MASYVKSIDPHHLLEIGLEGFYGASTPTKIPINPNSYQFGVDFIANNQISGIDFATVHSYPDWLHSEGKAQPTFLKQWVEKHIEDSQNIIQKPVIFAEFGKSYKLPGYKQADRDQLYRIVYSDIYASAIKGGAASGALLWQLLAEGMDSFKDGYEVSLNVHDSLGAIIFEESHKLSKLRKP
ncbi:hypothetical protein vseg_004314 [Gypsophila vaccaria]